MLLKIIFKEFLQGWSIILDALILYLTYLFITNIFISPESYIKINEIFLFVSIPLISLILTKSYNFFLRYISINDALKIIIVLIISNLILFLLISKSIQTFIFILLNFFISSSFIVFYRLFIKFLNRNIDRDNNKAFKVLIFGCGNSGILTKRALFNNSEFKVLGFVDDDKEKLNMSIDGIKVFGLNKSLEKFIKKNKIDKIIITTQKITSKRLKFLYSYFRKYSIQILKTPPVNEWINGVPLVSGFKEIKIEDLLGRSEINIDIKKNEKLYKGKNLLVTGAAGSIGSEIVRQLFKFNPKKIILVDNAETPMFLLREELKNHNCKIEFVYHINSVTNKKFISSLFKKNKINVVFHAAAYKHVNMMEINPKSAVYNNILGTKVVVDNSIKYKVEKFILISTDKAVNPTNVMGATKRICELYLSFKLTENKHRTSLISTRFGNVLGSNGSVVPIFKKQIKSGGPIKITHPEIVRYFMTISEATQLVLEAGAISKGGEVYIFDMGKPVKIVDLAKNMIIQSGFKPNEDICIEYIGLRPGEKLFEEILIESEGLEKTHNKLIYIAKKEKTDIKIYHLIEELITFLEKNNEDSFMIVEYMKKIVPEYKSNNSKYEVLDNA